MFNLTGLKKKYHMVVHDDYIFLHPSFQALSPLSPLLLGERSWLQLVTSPQVTQRVSTGVESTNNFCQSQMKQKKRTSLAITKLKVVHGQIF